MIAVMAAAHAQRVQTVYDSFRIAGATAPDRARSLAELGLDQCAEVGELADAGMLVPDRRGERWYLDEAAFVARRDAPRSHNARFVRVIVVLVLLLVPLYFVITSP